MALRRGDECEGDAANHDCAFSALQRAGARKTSWGAMAGWRAAPPGRPLVDWGPTYPQYSPQNQPWYQPQQQPPYRYQPYGPATTSSAVSTVHSQENRKTNVPCDWFYCDQASLGPSVCHQFQCICKETYFWSAAQQRCQASMSSTSQQDTGGSCYLSSCSAIHGFTRCVEHKCLCLEGYKVEGGKCVLESQSQAPAKADHEHMHCSAPKMGDACWKAVSWAMHDGIYADPRQYPGLHPGASSFREFQEHVHALDSGTCPKPCTVHYPTYTSPTLRDPSYRVLQGVAYGAFPIKNKTSHLNSDDFMAEAAGAMWADWGRGDLQLLREMGANTIRMYGNDANTSHRSFLDSALDKGLDVIVGMSDFGFTQGPDNCLVNDWYCFDEAYMYYHKNLLMGFTIDGFKRYHPALKVLTICNEPDLKVHPRELTCRAMASIFDAVLQAEKDLGVEGNPVALTITWSFADFNQKQRPALDQMEEFWACLQKGTQHSPINYKPKNDLVKAYRERFVNSFNTQSRASEVARMFMDNYAKSSFWTQSLKIPVFIGEYHHIFHGLETDLADAIDMAKSKKYPFFLGYNFFEFTKAYWKGGPEMKFGMLGYGNCALRDMDYVGQTYTIWDLVPLTDQDGQSILSKLQAAFGQGTSLPKVLGHPGRPCQPSTKGVP